MNLKPEFSRPLPIQAISQTHGLEQEISATPEECAKLAQRFGVPHIAHLRAHCWLKWVDGGKAVNITGTLNSALTQSCVITLEPLPASVDESFEALFAPEEDIEEIAEDEAEHSIDALAMTPEPIIGGVIDLGELVAQQFSLSLNPYPRKEGAYLPTEQGGVEAAGAPSTPFAVLKDWQKNIKK